MSTRIPSTRDRSADQIPHFFSVDLSLSSEAELRTLRVEDHVLALQEHITQDGQSQTAVALDTAVAGGAAGRNGSVVDVLARNDGLVVADHDSEVRKVSRARENVATSFIALLGAGNLLVVGGNDLIVEEDEGGTGVYTLISKEKARESEKGSYQQWR